MSEEHYKKLQEAALVFFEREKALFDRAAYLQQELDTIKSQKAEAEATQCQQVQQLEELWKTLEQSREDQQEAEDNDKLLQSEIQELEYEKQGLEEQHSDALRILSQEVEPQFQHLKTADASIRQDIERNDQAISALQQQLNEVAENHDDVISSIKNLEQDKLSELDKVKDFEKLFKLALDDYNDALKEEQAQRVCMKKKEDEVRAVLDEIKYLGKKINSLKTDVGVQSKMLNKISDDEVKKQTGISKIESNLASAEQNVLLLTEEKGDLEQQLESLKFNISNISKNEKSAQRHREEFLSKIKKFEDECGLLKQTISMLKVESLTIQKEKEGLLKSVEYFENQQISLQKDIGILIGQVLSSDSLTEENMLKMAEFKNLIHETESDLSGFLKSHDNNLKEISNLKNQREMTARKATNLLQKLQHLQQVFQSNENLIFDLTRSGKRQAAELKLKQQNFEILKAEMNSLRLQVQGQNQNTVELREKLKILESERNILRNEAQSKDAQLNKSSSENKNLQTSRDSLAAQATKIAENYFKLESKLNENIVEIDRLSSLIDRSEKELMRLRNNYEGILQMRNQVGLQLIDRNDELCVLYEKLNIQEDLIKNATCQMSKRDDEYKFLQNFVIDLTRSLDIARKKIQKIPELEEEALKLHAELSQAKVDTIQLGNELENPDNTEIFKFLPGELETEEQMFKKINDIEAQIARKQEEILEAELTLTEITTLTTKVGSKITDDNDVSLKIARDGSELKARLREVTKKMTAAERRDAEAVLDSALKNLAQGNPPTESSDLLFEKEAARIERQNIQISQDDDDVPKPPPRPNAYIPDDELGLPKPYGQFGPFMPSQPGASMRHIRKPKEMVIEI
ncbi:hypothetical protein GEMRC1_000506 [Eukaryota sp. GEM-RC1]